jgi:glycosyltransferase involved in cell wall biosynthesis
LAVLPQPMDNRPIVGGGQDPGAVDACRHGPAISVVIPTRDRFVRLERTLATALRQQEVNLEVVVVHDGPDGGRSDALKARMGDPRVRVVVLSAPAGMTAARNAGLAHASGDWVAFLDDDDLWSPHKLCGQLAAAKADAAFVYSSAVSINDRWRVIYGVRAPDPRSLSRRLVVRNEVPAGASNIMVRREILIAIDGFDEGFRLLADWDAWIRLAAAYPAAADPSYTVAYVMHPGNRSASSPAEHRQELRRLAVKHRELARSLGVTTDEGWFLRVLAGGQRRSGHRLTSAGLYVQAALRNRNPVDLARGAHAALGLPPPRHRVPRLPWLESLASEES